MTVRFYSSTAQPTTLALNATAASLVIEVAALVGYPSSFPYTLCLDYDTGLRELVQVNNAAGTTLTVVRGVDGTSAIDHSAGATVRHVSSARDYADSRAHENASMGVHGLGMSSAVVGEDEVQTLTNKTLTSPAINGGTITGATITGSTIDAATFEDVTITSSANGTVGLTLEALPAQTANIVEVFDDSAFKRLTVDRDGTLATFSGDTTLGYAAKVDPAAADNNVVNLSVRNKANVTTLAFRASGQMVSQVSEDTFMVDLQRPASVASDAISYRRNGVARFNVEDDGSVISQGDLTVAGTAGMGATTVSSLAVSGNATVTGAISASNFQEEAWTSYAVTWGVAAGTPPAIGNGSLTGRYAKNGRVVHVHIRMAAGNTTTFGTGNWTFTLPVAAFQFGANDFSSGTATARDDSGGGGVTPGISICDTNNATPVILVLNSSNGAVWNSGAPFTWATSDILTIDLVFQSAS